jgi:type II secretory pathway pseudopilin PulG
MGSSDARTNEAGFTILESTIALSLVFATLVALLGALTAGSRGLITGRQRSAALAMANEVLEGARGRAYGDVGHDFDSDPTLTTDPAITGTSPNFMYNGEPLAASAVNAGASGGTVTNPLFPFSPHKFVIKREQTNYTTLVYVTTVTPASGDVYKRITTKVSWSPAQYVTAARSVTLSSFLFNAEAPPDPKLVGTGEVDAGSFEVHGTLAGISLSDARLTLPYVSGGIDSGFVRSAKGLARSGASEVNLLGGVLSGCSLLGLLGASCNPALAAADADNDSGTAPPDTDQENPSAAGGGTILAAPALTFGVGSGTAKAQATARSCWSCYPADPPVGDDDRLPHFYGRATGPATVSMDVLSAGTLGKFLSFSTSPTATVTVDRHDSGSNQLVSSTTSAAFPALSLMTLTTGPLGYSGMVKVGAISVAATAEAGPGAVAPSVTSGPAVNVQYWTGASYATVSITAGVAASVTIPSVSILSGLGFVTVSGSITSTPKVIQQTAAGGVTTQASASLTNWLYVDLNVTMPGGTSVNLHFDYGRLAATAAYQPVA